MNRKWGLQIILGYHSIACSHDYETMETLSLKAYLGKGMQKLKSLI